MRYRSVGGSRISALGLGCMGMSGIYGEASEATSIATIQRAMDLGVTLFDTAEIYGPWHNEILLARALGSRRDEIKISTKFGFEVQDGKTVGVSSRPESVRKSVDGSLRRLGTDNIDILFQHRVDPAVPIEDVAGTVGDLIREGKVRHFGLSEAGAATIERAHAVTPVTALQSEYSLWERNLDTEILPLLRRLGIGLIAFSPLGRGFLAGSSASRDDMSPADIRRDDPRFAAENFAINLAAAKIVRAIAQDHDAAPAQIAIAWLLAQGDDIVPIPGTKSRANLEVNIGALSVSLSQAEIAKLSYAMRSGKIVGERYGERHLKMIDR